MSISNVIQSGSCIGCGNCVVGDKGADMEFDKFGLLTPLDLNEANLTDTVCPVSNKVEDRMNKEYEPDSLSYNPQIGYFRKVYAGYMNNDDRLNSSSGGLTSFLLTELFERELIDGALVVTNGEAGELEYRVALSHNDLSASKKSKYQMVSHNKVAEYVLENPGRYAYVGIPCGVKAIKLLAEHNEIIDQSIVYTLSVFCGHQKSKSFSEYVGWQMRVLPSELLKLDYRIKKKVRDASLYFYGVLSRSGDKNIIRVDRLKWMDWGIGLFKPKACELCDDVAGECADVILGDAWHNKYSSDYRGTNVVITRKPIFDELLCSGEKENKISLFNESEKFVFDTQGGNFRHRQHGLLARIDHFKQCDFWLPNFDESRIKRYKKPENSERYVERFNISQKSHEVFLKAKVVGDINVFYKEMKQDVEAYLNRNTSVKDRFYSRVKSFIKRCL